MPVQLEPPEFNQLMEYKLDDVQQLIDLEKEKLTNKQTDIEATMQLINDLKYIMSYISILRFRNHWDLLKDRHQTQQNNTDAAITNTLTVNTLELNMCAIAKYLPKRISIELYRQLYEHHSILHVPVHYSDDEIKQMQNNEIEYMDKHPLNKIEDMLQLHQETRNYPHYQEYQMVIDSIDIKHFYNDRLIKHIQHQVHRLLNQWYQQQTNVEHSVYKSQITNMINYDMIKGEIKPNKPHQSQSWIIKCLNWIKQLWAQITPFKKGK